MLELHSYSEEVLFRSEGGVRFQNFRSTLQSCFVLTNTPGLTTRYIYICFRGIFVGLLLTLRGEVHGTMLMGVFDFQLWLVLGS